MNKRNKILSIIFPFIVAISLHSNRMVVNASELASLPEEETYDEDGNLIITDELLNEIINYKYEKCNYKFDGNVDNLVNNIVNNSNDYLKTHKEYNSILNSQKNINLLKNVLEKLIQTSTNDINGDIHRMTSLKIIEGTLDDNITGLYDDKNNIIYINSKMIKFMSECDGVSYDKALEKIYFHELNHVRQTNCPCRERKNYNDMRYSIYEVFYLESSAESYNVNNALTYDNATYEEERFYESQIMLLGLLNNKSIDEYYNSIFDNNISDLINFYNLSEKDFKTFYDIIKNIDALCIRNKMSENLLEKNKDDYSTTIEQIGFNYKIDLMNMCIDRLMSYTEQNNISLEENLVLYDNIKNIILYNNNDIEYSNNLKNEISKLDDSYISYLSKKYNIDVEEIRNKEYINIRVISESMYELSTNLELTNKSQNEVATYYLNKYPILNDIYSSVDKNYYNQSVDMYKEKYQY